MNTNNLDLIRIYVGTDRSQQLAVKVLEFSIRRHTDRQVQVIPLLDMPIPAIVDPRNSQRTGFSFARFCIPQLAGYKGKALYLDADMLVFSDISKLWDLDFESFHLLIQKEIKHQDLSVKKIGAPKKRNKQCAVMLLDCKALSWDIKKIIEGLNLSLYDYDQLMAELCIVEEKFVGFKVPFEWNSLEHYDEGTCLLHYTDVYTQPWTSCHNHNGYLWFNEVRLMLKQGEIQKSELEEEIAIGYFRPSLMLDIKYRHLIPKRLLVFWDSFNTFRDKVSGYVPHREVYEMKKKRQAAIREYERVHIKSGR